MKADVPCFGHISQYALTAPRKLHISLMFLSGSCLRFEDIHFFQGLSPIGNPSLSVSWIAYVHMRGLIVKPFASRQETRDDIIE